MPKEYRESSDLRSHRWFGADDIRAFGHRSRTMQIGLDREEFMGRPVIGIINTWSDINPCHTHLRALADDVKRGVYQAGGYPVEIPAITLAETIQKPTTMMYRNLLAMETEELLRSYPIDGAILMGGCDKTTPALILGAISMNLPTIFVPAGPMLTARWRGQTLGSGSDQWKFWDMRRRNEISHEEHTEVEGNIARSAGTCMTMGTASTMTTISEALGISLSGSASIPAPDSEHKRMAARSGRRIVSMVWEDQKILDILTLEAFENAVVCLMATGGSTNAIIHLQAMARRAGLEFPLDRFNEFSERIPVLANIRPVGVTYLMEDFYYAGGLPSLLKRLEAKLHTDCMTCDGKTLGENIKNAKVWNDDVIRPLNNPVRVDAGLTILRGNLAPGGAVIKAAAMDQRFLEHEGPAMVFEDYNDLEARIDDPDLDVDENSVLVLRNSGPKGGPGMPEWGMIPIPRRLLVKNVKDIMRVSDARMSGTSYGCCILHVSPESWIGGPLALVKTGDRIYMNVATRTLSLFVDDEELLKRKAAWAPPEKKFARGYGKMMSEHILQADEGCDFDFLTGSSSIDEPEIH